MSQKGERPVSIQKAGRHRTRLKLKIKAQTGLYRLVRMTMRDEKITILHQAQAYSHFHRVVPEPVEQQCLFKDVFR